MSNPSPSSVRANNAEPLPGDVNQPLSAASVPNPSPASSTRANNAEPLLLLTTSNYHVDSCFLSETLLDEADNAEKICWGDKFLPTDSQCEDLKDPKGYYKVLGCSKTTSSKGIATVFQTTKTNFTAHAWTHHPDKTSEKENIAQFHHDKNTYELQKSALEVL